MPSASLKKREPTSMPESDLSLKRAKLQLLSIAASMSIPAVSQSPVMTFPLCASSLPAHPAIAANSDQVPPELLFPAVWKQNSCAFDSFFEAISALFHGKNHLLQSDVRIEDVNNGLANLYGTHPYDSFEKCLVHIISYRLSANVPFDTIKVISVTKRSVMIVILDSNHQF